jgi:signal transduction histidine kinase
MRTSRLVADGALIAGLVVLLIGTAIAIAGSWGGLYWAPGAAVDVVIGTLAVARRPPLVRYVAGALVTALVAVGLAARLGLPAQPGPAAVLGLSVLVGAAMRRLAPRVALALGSGGVAVVVATWLASGPVLGASAVTAMNAVGLAAGVVAGLSLRLLDGRRRAEADAIRRNERLSLAAELHDTAAHHFTGIILQAQAAQLVLRRPARMTGVDSRVLEPALSGIESAASDGLAAVRQLVGLLRDPTELTRAEPVSEALVRLVDQFNEQHPGRPATLDLVACEEPWPPELVVTVTRVVQEALTNVARHDPKASSVTVRVTQDAQAVEVAVANRRAGRAPSLRPHEPGYGLVGMRERVLALGGTFRAGPVGDDWRVQAVVPHRSHVVR